MLNPESEILIACTRRALEEPHRRRIRTTCDRVRVDWDRVLAAALAHRVAPLVYHHLQSCDGVVDLIPLHVRGGFARCMAIERVRRGLVSFLLGALKDHCAARSHDVMLIKGAALDHVLGDFYTLTMANDADVIVRPAPGASDRFDTRGTWRVISEFLDAEPLEIDNRVHHDISMNGLLPIDFDKVWDEADRVSVDGREFLVPNRYDNLIFACINAIRKPCLRLRCLLDVTELAGGPARLDEGEVARRSAGYGCDRIVYAVLRASEAILGSEFGVGLPGALRPGTVRARAIGWVAQGIASRLAPHLPPSGGGSRPAAIQRSHERRCPWSLALRLLSIGRGQWLPYTKQVCHRIAANQPLRLPGG